MYQKWASHNIHMLIQHGCGLANKPSNYVTYHLLSANQMLIPFIQLLPSGGTILTNSDCHLLSISQCSLVLSPKKQVFYDPEQSNFI